MTARGDGELIAAVRAGDTGAYDLLYSRHREAALVLARQLGRGPADAEDVVADAFTRVLGVLRRGGGPDELFRPYLLTAVRHAAYDHARAQRAETATEQHELPDPGEPFADPAVASLERSLAARAFRSLPERWRAVLWYTEVEQARPAEVAPLLGLTPNGVAALAYRAREGLRRAYLQLHLQSLPREECRPAAGKLGALVRGGLSRRDARMVREHLDGCAECRTAHAELAGINATLRGSLAPVIMGGAAAGYVGGLAVAASQPGRLAALGHLAAAAQLELLRSAGQHLAWLPLPGRLRQLRRRPGRTAATAGAALALAAGVALSAALTADSAGPGNPGAAAQAGEPEAGLPPTALPGPPGPAIPPAPVLAHQPGPSGGPGSPVSPAPTAAPGPSGPASPGPGPAPRPGPAPAPSPSSGGLCLIIGPLGVCVRV